MPEVRLLIGTRKGAFIMTSDADRKSWDIDGPHFGGWEIFHMAGSPANPERAPDKDIRFQIESTVEAVKRFAGWIRSGEVKPASGGKFENVILAGIGGSALGPQLAADALGGPNDSIKIYFCDNTDPDGIDRTLAEVGDRLKNTLTLVISKSGGTAETRNCMLEIRNAYQAAEIEFASRAVAVTGEGSRLAELAEKEDWLAIFPMWDWVGGRTSELSAVGLLPAALQGFDVDEMLCGAREMDKATRNKTTRENPAAMLALMKYEKPSILSTVASR